MTKQTLTALCDVNAQNDPVYFLVTLEVPSHVILEGDNFGVSFLDPDYDFDKELFQHANTKFSEKYETGLDRDSFDIVCLFSGAQIPLKIPTLYNQVETA